MKSLGGEKISLESVIIRTFGSRLKVWVKDSRRTLFTLVVWAAVQSHRALGGLLYNGTNLIHEGSALMT